MFLEKITAATKGVPSGGPYEMAAFKSYDWNIHRGDVPFPVALLKQSALANNSEVMRNYLAATGASLAPHGKTTMSPELFHQQLEDGAWGLTAATSAHVQVYVDNGVRRIFFANQLIGQQNIKHILQLLVEIPELDFYSLVDSVAGVEHLAKAARVAALSIPLKVLIEVGTPGGRTGVRSHQQGATLASLIHRLPEISLVGIEAFEGIFGRSKLEVNVTAVRGLLREVIALAEIIDKKNQFASDLPILSAGGSGFFDLVVDAFSQASFAAQILLRSGCYLTQDHGMYQPLHEAMQARDARLQTFVPALEVWGCVQSRPEPELAIVNLGKRDISYDLNLPTPLYHLNQAGELLEVEGSFATQKLNDQHTFIKIPSDADLAVGDLMGFGISHPCTTFDKWQLMYVVDDDYAVIDAIHTCF